MSTRRLTSALCLCLRLCLCLALWVALPACDDSDNGGAPGGTTSGSTSGFTSGGSVTPDDRQHPTGGQSWTYLVYLLADTDLEPFALEDLQEMARVGSGDNFNLIVLVDRAAGYSSAGVLNLPNFEGAKLLKVERGSLTELMDLGEINMGDPAVLADFIAYGLESYPADRVALDFWDHGGAWPGFGPDDSHGDVLTLPEIEQGLREGLARAGRKELSLIGFDACLMATYEVAMVTRAHGEYLLASEELEPGHGWDYEALRVLRDDPTTDPVRLGRAIADGYRAQAAKNFNQKGISYAEGITLSLVDLYALADVEAATVMVNEALGANPSGVAAALASARQGAIEFGGNPDPAQSSHMVDFGDFLSRAASVGGGLSGARERLNAALSKAVLYNVTGSMRSGSMGLSIYWPSNIRYYKGDYDQVPHVDTWRNNIKGKGVAGQSIPQGQRPVFTNLNKAADVRVVGPRTVEVSGQLAEASLGSLAYALLYYAVVEDGVFYVIGDTAAQVSGGGLVTATWDTDIFTLTQGGRQVFAYLSLAYEAGQLVASVPFTYVAPDGGRRPVLLVLGTNSQGGVISSTFYAQNGVGYGELVPERGSRLYPLVLAVSDSGNAWIPTPGDGVDPNAPYEFSFVSLGLGTAVYLELNAYDYGDNSDYVSFSGEL